MSHDTHPDQCSPHAHVAPHGRRWRGILLGRDGRQEVVRSCASKTAAMRIAARLRTVDTRRLCDTLEDHHDP
jgi:hypothetical protein